MIRWCSGLALVAAAAPSITTALKALHKTTFLNAVSLTIPDALLALQSGSHEITFGKLQCHVDISPESTATLQLSSSFPNEPISSLLQAIVFSSSQRLKRPCKFITAACELITSVSTAKEGEMVDWMCIDGITSLAELPRQLIHQHNLLHRGIGVLILDNQGRIFVHQRSNTKRLFPAMYDMFVGGVSAAGEAPGITLLRELQEEVGLDFRTSPAPIGHNNNGNDNNLSFESQCTDQASTDNVNAISKGRKTKHVAATMLENYQQSQPSGNLLNYLGRTTIQTSYNHCIVDCYAAMCSEDMAKNVGFNDGEVQWGEWMKPSDLDTFLEQQESKFVPDGLQVWYGLANMNHKNK